MAASAHRRNADPLASVAGHRTTARSEVPDTPSAPDTPVKPGPCILSVDEIITLYPDEWVLMRVTAAESGWPSHGEVIVHSASRARITEAWSTVVGTRAPEDHHYVFQAYRHIRTGAEAREVLEGLQKTWDGEVDGPWRRW